MKPVVGIFPNIDYENNSICLNNDYYNAIVNSGGVPVIIPYMDKKLVLELINRLDGIVFSGGNDMDPYYISEDPIPESGKIIPDRDELELIVAKYCLERGIPCLGICRGMQVMGVAANCGFFQDIFIQYKKPVIKHKQEAPRWYPTHEVNIDENSTLYTIFKKNRIKVNSFHHQAVRDIDKDIIVSAKSNDDVIEAIEHKNHPFYIGIQWHPENMINQYPIHKEIFRAFIMQCKEKDN